MFYLQLRTNRHVKEKDRNILFDKYNIILGILNESVEISYQKLWREDISVYLLSGYKLGDKEFSEYGKKFISKVMNFCGPEIINDLEIIHGNLDSICYHLISEFFSRIVQDEANLKMTTVSNQEDNLNAN
jgi:hypothetical protein